MGWQGDRIGSRLTLSVWGYMTAKPETQAIHPASRGGKPIAARGCGGASRKPLPVGLNGPSRDTRERFARRFGPGVSRRVEYPIVSQLDANASTNIL